MSTKKDGVTRRTFLVVLAGVSLGKFFLPPLFGGRKKAASRSVRKFLEKPTKTKLVGGGFSLEWTEELDDGDVITITWAPETPEEIADATALYDASRDVGVDDEAEGKGPLGKLASRVGELFESRSGRSADEERLLAAIRADLGANEPRLTYARWLMQRGDPLGGWIEADILMETLPETDPRWKELDERWTDLMDKHGETWVKPLKKLGFSMEFWGCYMPSLWFKRGFVEELEIDNPRILPKKADKLFQAAPILHRIKLNYDKMDVAGIVSLPQLAQVDALDFTEVEIDLSALKALIASPRLSRLRELRINGAALDDGGAQLLAESPLLPRLTYLHLKDWPLSPVVAKILATSGALYNLETFDLSYSDNEATTIAMLAASRHLAKVRTLNLEFNHLGDAGITAVAHSSTLCGLRELNVGHCKIGPQGVKALASSKCLGQLTTLDLSGNSGDTEAIRALARGAGSLTTLDLSYIDLEQAAVLELANSPKLANLSVLRLNSCKIGPIGVRAIAESPHLTRLTELALFDCDVGLDGARALAESANLANLKTLELNKDDVPPKGVALLRKRFREDVCGALVE
jgi:uncharacterized protein (TIGR02996 family)